MPKDFGLILERDIEKRVVLGGRDGGFRLFPLKLEEARHFLAWVDAFDRPVAPPELRPFLERLRQWRADPIVVTHVDTRGHKARLGFKAAQEISVDRLELLEEINREQREKGATDEAHAAEASEADAPGRGTDEAHDLAWSNVEAPAAYGAGEGWPEGQGGYVGPTRVHSRSQEEKREQVRSPRRGSVQRSA